MKELLRLHKAVISQKREGTKKKKKNKKRKRE